MEKYDYSELGLKSGLEIHQQLDTRKLFCNCPSMLRQDEPDFIIKRKLHAIAGETGVVDVAAEFQAALKKEFTYQGYKDNCCLIELDEEPPKQINHEALKIALQISLLLNCKILPLTQIMRKTVIDGSNVSGFQRTVLIAKNGYVETSSGKVGIQSICLEEDAARIIQQSEKGFIYRLDRLGIPLVEIATDPDIKTPEQAKEVALHIGDVLRSCKVKRGIGTIRQDVNMSIKGGSRIEIKGVQDPDLIVKTINSEIKRQLRLLDKKEKISSEVRKALPDGETGFLRPMPGSARMYPETDLPILKISRDLLNEVKKDLPKLRSEITEDLRKEGISEELLKLILQEDKIEEFKELMQVRKEPNLVAKLLTLYLKELSVKNNLSIEKVNEILHKDILVSILENLNKNKINESQIRDVLERVINGEEISKALIFEKRDVNKIEEKILKIIKEMPGLNANAYMGLVMKEFKGKISGKEAMEIISKLLKNK